MVQFRRFSFYMALLIVAGCSSLSPVTHTGAQDGAAILASRPDKITLVWPGDPAMPNLRLLNLGESQTSVLALGVTPHQVTLYPAGDGGLQILWLDQTSLGDERLVGALLDSQQSIKRGPTILSTHSTSYYQAALAPSGDLIAVWAESESASGVTNLPTPVYVQLIDSDGRPHAPLLLASSGKYPTVAFDTNGDLHLSWLELASLQVWTVHYAVIPAADVINLARWTDWPSGTLKNSLMGVITPAAGQTVERFSMGVDATSVYCLWQLTSISSGAEMGGLSFPINDPINTKSLPLTGLKGLRWSTILPAPEQPLTMAMVGQQDQHDIPLLVTLQPDRISIEPLTTENTGQIDRVSLAADGANTLYIAWTALQADGSSAVFSTTHSR